MLWVAAMLAGIAADAIAGADDAQRSRIVGTLLGVRQPAVLIETPDGRAQHLHAGDALDGCTIERIVARRIDVACNGLRQRRPLQGDASGDRAPPLDSASTRTATVLSASAFRALLADPQRLVAEIALAPRVRDGRLHGYAVDHLKPGGLFDGQGLETGDVIVAVDGTPANEPDPFMQTLDAVRDARRFRLSIERLGVTRELPVELH